VHWPFVAGEIAIEVAVTAPVSSVAPRAATHLPTASACAVAALVVVYVVDPVSVTLTERVVVVGVPDGVEAALGGPDAVPTPVTVTAATTNPDAETEVTWPNVIAPPKNRRGADPA
jgi:hypothetical protein